MSPPTAAEDRAAAAERTVRSRYVRRLWGLPGTRLGLVRDPGGPRDRLRGTWHYWWQAHLLDCLLDAQERDPAPERAAVADALVRGVYLRNPGWLNRYYDDVAWMGLAVHRLGRSRPVWVIDRRLAAGWTDAAGGGIWWRLRDDFKNVPANGPAAILLARTGRLDRARAMTEWMESRLRCPDTGLMWDGLRVNAAGEVYEIVKTFYTYCQGVHLGACVELALADPKGPWAERAARTVVAVGEHLAPGGVLRGHGDHDGGLFTGILARYLADSAVRLPDAEGGLAARLVEAAAEAAWANRSADDRFGASFADPAASGPTADLSVQLSGWMTLEAAARLERNRR